MSLVALLLVSWGCHSREEIGALTAFRLPLAVPRGTRYEVQPTDHWELGTEDCELTYAPCTMRYVAN